MIDTNRLVRRPGQVSCYHRVLLCLAGIVTLQSRITNVQNVNFATPAQYLLDKSIWEFEGGQDQAQQLLDKAIAQAKSK